MLSKSTEYAIRALVYVAVSNARGEKPGYRDIAGEVGAPPHFMAKILQQLSRHALVFSGRGRAGGFFLEKGGEEVSLYDIIVAIEGEKKLHGCGFGLPGCSSERPCPFHELYAPIREQYQALARNTSIASLATSVKQGKAFLWTAAGIAG